MKNKIIGIILIIISVVCLTGCRNMKLKGKYEYGTNGDDIYGYFDCKSNELCYWYMYIKSIGISNATYQCTIQKNDDGTYTIHMDNIENNSNTNFDVIYDTKKETIYDPELNITYKKDRSK